MTPPRLLALDLDGTLLRQDHSIDPRDVAAIGELQRAGVVVTIVTGRLYPGAIEAARTCGIEGAIGCVEGSHIADAVGDRVHAHHALAPDDAAVLRGAIHDAGLAAFVFDAGGIHHGHRGAPYADYIRVWSPAIRVVEDDEAWATQALGVVAVGETAAVLHAHATLASHASRVFSVQFEVRGHPGMSALLARTAGPHKGTALAELCRLAGCTVDDAVVVGDWINDVPMFRVAGRSFSMATAPDDVRAAASDVLVTEAGAGGGIAEAIRRAWG